jgi:adenylyltransferase/sulfurtransferase
MGLERYTRHLSLPNFGKTGPLRLKQATALVVGVGGLGSVSSLHLSRVCVGTIGLMHDDLVSRDNLHRQILYTTDDLGESKLARVVETLKHHNPEVNFITYPHRLTGENALTIIRNYDLVIDGTENVQARQVINQASVKLDKPYLHGAVNLYDGEVSVLYTSQGPCWRCLYPHRSGHGLEKTAEQLPVLNTLPAVVAALQATEAIKLLPGGRQAPDRASAALQCASYSL